MDVMRMRIKKEIIDYTCLHGYPPSVQELCAAVGYKSTSSVQKYLSDMIASGELETDAPASPRAIRIPGMRFVSDEPDLNGEDEKAVAAMEYLKTYCKRQWCDTCGLGDNEFCWMRDVGCPQG